MNWPCPNKVDCAGSDFPLMNVSSEGPDQIMYQSVGFCCNGQQVWAFSLANQYDADDYLQRLMALSCPDCEAERQYCSTATCPDGTVLAKYCSPISQEYVDAYAKQREDLMRPYCDDVGNLYSATCACPDGSNPVTMYSPFSDDDAMAACESVPKDCPQACNTAQPCTVTCPDGTEFTYVQPACTIYAATVEEANAIAYAMACQRAADLRVCLGPIIPCTCRGDIFATRINATGPVTGLLTWTVYGTLPPGVFLIPSATDNTAELIGVPTTAGHYTFTVQATTAQGSSAQRTYTIYVIAITTASLPDFTLGVAYSYQLAATGGSGQYVWRVLSGTLPPGITLSSTGLLSGTPTANGSFNVQFEVVDLACEAATRTFFVPRVSLRTEATTTLKIKRGYPEYVHGTGRVYKKCTWQGSITQTAKMSQASILDPETGLLSQADIGGARYEYSGSSQIDVSGNFISHHEKRLYVACNRATYPPVAEGPNAEAEVLAPGMFAGSSVSRIHNLIGYCWAADHGSCPVCPTSESEWVFRDDYAIDSQEDLPEDLLTDAANYEFTPTTLVYAGTATGRFAIADVSNWPYVPVDLFLYTDVSATGYFSATLSEPYSDEDAEATKQTYHSSLAIAENLPDYLIAAGNQFLRLIYSRNTTVNYTLEFMNLVRDQTYTATWELVDSSGTITRITQSFVATATIHQLTGTLPEPEAGHTITIRNATVRYAI